MTKKEKIIEEIRKIYDPELPVNIYELGLIYDVQVENDKLTVSNRGTGMSWKVLLEKI